MRIKALTRVARGDPRETGDSRTQWAKGKGESAEVLHVSYRSWCHAAVTSGKTPRASDPPLKMRAGTTALPESTASQYLRWDEGTALKHFPLTDVTVWAFQSSTRGESRVNGVAADYLQTQTVAVCAVCTRSLWRRERERCREAVLMSKELLKSILQFSLNYTNASGGCKHQTSVCLVKSSNHWVEYFVCSVSEDLVWLVITTCVEQLMSWNPLTSFSQKCKHKT